ncbi:MAG: hypothetical protein ACR2JJ_00185 [Sphingomicrobium sp.]
MIPALALALCACSREPGFDERYSEAENEIEERARDLEEQLQEADANGASDGEPAVPPD